MRPKRKPLLILLVKRVVFFLTIMSALSVFLYGIGNAQDFLESTQMILLRLSASLGILLSVGSFCGFFLDIYYSIVDRKPRFLWGAFSYLFSIAFGFSVAFFSNGVLVLVSGNLP